MEIIKEILKGFRNFKKKCGKICKDFVDSFSKKCEMDSEKYENESGFSRRKLESLAGKEMDF